MYTHSTYMHAHMGCTIITEWNRSRGIPCINPSLRILYVKYPVHVSIGVIFVSGSDDNTDLELYNGRTNLYLQVKQVGHGYKVKVAERPLVSDTCVTACIISQISAV